jgi:2-polyprenyl-3-methyl-5-hydroxy-6-metoxy-1,4-benzoquinol methylase
VSCPFVHFALLAESLALEGAIVTGIDMAEAGLEVAKLHLLESITFKLISFCKRVVSHANHAF